MALPSRDVLCELLFWKKEKDGVSLTSALAREKIFLRRGHSSVGRAVALQAIGQGFESPCLHSTNVAAVYDRRQYLAGPEL